MDKTITTALLIAVSMIMVIMLFNISYPAVIQGGEAVTSMANGIADRMKHQILIVHASAMVDSNAQSTIYIWVKNIGDARIIGLTQMDLFFGPEGNFTRIPQESEAQGTFPYWTWQVQDTDDWIPTSTLQITLHFQSALADGRYFMKVVLPNGVSSDYLLGI